MINDDLTAGLAGLSLPEAEPPRRRRRAVDDSPKVAKAQAIDPALAQHNFCGRRVRIIIERSHDPNDLPTVFLKLNDYMCTIKRGEEVNVPVELLGVLDDAGQTSFSQPEDGVMIPISSLRFPYRIVHRPEIRS